MGKGCLIKLASAGITVAVAGCSSQAAAPPLTEAMVKQSFVKDPAWTSCIYTWQSVQIAPARPASLGEISAVGMPPHAIVTPVRVAYTRACKPGFTRDYRWNYYFFKDDFGAWTKQANAMPGNYESEPR